MSFSLKEHKNTDFTVVVHASSSLIEPNTQFTLFFDSSHRTDNEQCTKSKLSRGGDADVDDDTSSEPIPPTQWPCNGDITICSCTLSRSEGEKGVKIKTIDNFFTSALLCRRALAVRVPQSSDVAINPHNLALLAFI